MRTNEIRKYFPTKLAEGIDKMMAMSKYKIFKVIVTPNSHRLTGDYAV